MSKPSLLRRVFSALWNGITRIRLALSNLLFLLTTALSWLITSIKPWPEAQNCSPR